MRNDVEVIDRSIERQRLLRSNGLRNLALYLAYPPCSRHDDGADDQAERVKLTWAYALGLLRDRERAARLSARVLRLHDHKGLLSVVSAGPLPGDLERALCRAWAEMAAEMTENVVLEAPGSASWRAVWEARRFSDETLL